MLEKGQNANDTGLIPKSAEDWGLQKNKKNWNKKFCWIGDILSVQSRTFFPYKKHLIKKALNLLAAFL